MNIVYGQSIRTIRAVWFTFPASRYLNTSA